MKLSRSEGRASVGARYTNRAIRVLLSSYDVYDSPAVFSGVVESWEWWRPHLVMKFRASEQHGGHLWAIEVATQRRQNANIPTDAIKEDDEMAMMGWLRRDSSPEMVFGVFDQGSRTDRLSNLSYGE